MTTLSPSLDSKYASGYVKGRYAAKERIPVSENPFRAGSPAAQGWNDGYYDELSVRKLAIQRHSAEIWSGGDTQ